MKKLTEQLRDAKTALLSSRERAAAPHANPSDAFASVESIKRLEGEIALLEVAIDENHAEASRLEEMIARLERSEHSSRQRSLTITILESAALRLRGEI